jgi:hypothetical protein
MTVLCKQMRRVLILNCSRQGIPKPLRNKKETGWTDPDLCINNEKQSWDTSRKVVELEVTLFSGILKLLHSCSNSMPLHFTQAHLSSLPIISKPVSIRPILILSSEILLVFQVMPSCEVSSPSLRTFVLSYAIHAPFNVSHFLNL